MVLALFNGSYIGKRNTGIGVVSKNLISALPCELVTALDPVNSGRDGSIEIPSDLSPENGLRGHSKRLYWLEKNIPKLIKDSGAKFLLSPLPEAPLFSPVRSIVLAHDLLPLRYPDSKALFAYYSLYVPQVFNKAELILCNSEATSHEISQKLNVPKSKLVTINLGFDREHLYPKNLNREEFFLVLGRHNPHKNLARVLKALSFIAGKETRIIFVGPSDPRYTPKLKKIAKELELSDQLVWRDWVSDEEKSFLLNKCRALIIASLWEGFGLPALEAMACGTPVIASNVGGLPEVVGHSALLINPHSYESIANAMLEISSNSNLQEEAQYYGPQEALKYDWNKTSIQIQDILKSL